MEKTPAHILKKLKPRTRTATTAEIVENITRADLIAEQQIKLLCKRANAGDKDAAIWPDEGIEITDEQTRKGLEWLRKQQKRRSSPFGYREDEALDTFEKFTFDGLHDAGNVHRSWYAPVYSVYGTLKDGSRASFQYYVSGGECVIIG